MSLADASAAFGSDLKSCTPAVLCRKKSIAVRQSTFLHFVVEYNNDYL